MRGETVLLPFATPLGGTFSNLTFFIKNQYPLPPFQKKFAELETVSESVSQPFSQTDNQGARQADRKWDVQSQKEPDFERRQGGGLRSEEKEEPLDFSNFRRSKSYIITCHFFSKLALFKTI